MDEERQAHDELCCYTLAHGDPSFIHQHVVDAYMAQHAGSDTKPIGIAFALLGLHLYIEKNYSGRQVQLAHMKLGKSKREWPRFPLPERRGDFSVADVMQAAPGAKRDQAIRLWCVSVWQAYSASHEAVRAFARVLFDQGP